jgi:hypothetical protein
MSAQSFHAQVSNAMRVAVNHENESVGVRNGAETRFGLDFSLK